MSRLLIIFATLVAAVAFTASDVAAHGGGCRKSSPPGQCCHMDKKAGEVHCH